MLPLALLAEIATLAVSGYYTYNRGRRIYDNYQHGYYDRDRRYYRRRNYRRKYNGRSTRYS